jgi:hypothetical protein
VGTLCVRSIAAGRLELEFESEADKVCRENLLVSLAIAAERTPSTAESIPRDVESLRAYFCSAVVTGLEFRGDIAMLEVVFPRRRWSRAKEMLSETEWT